MFEGFEIEHNGETGKVEARSIIELLSVLESTSSDINRVRETEPETLDMGLSKVAIVYCRILRFIGLNASDYEIAVKLRSDADYVKKVYGDILKVVTALRPPADYAPQIDPKPQAETQEPKSEEPSK